MKRDGRKGEEAGEKRERRDGGGDSRLIMKAQCNCSRKRVFHHWAKMPSTNSQKIHR